MASKFLLALSLALLLSVAVGERYGAGREKMGPRLTRPQQCRIQRISVAQPQKQIQSEGGLTELWDEEEDQFQCVGAVAMRTTLRPNALSLPNFHPNPRLVYIERGQGFIGVTITGCAETFRGEQGQEQERARESHQKVHRVRKGDIIAIPPSTVHWCHNDGNEDLVAISINDMNQQLNQLDNKFRALYLAGGAGAHDTFHNVFQALDAELMAEAFNVSPELIRKMQSVEEERGLSVIARESMSYVRPEEEEEEESRRRSMSHPHNGFEETLCTMRILTNIDSAREADVYSRDAGKLNVVDVHKLPILNYLDMSAEKANLFPNAMLSPNWAMQDHSIVYVTRGEAQVQIVDHSGQAAMNDRAREGDMFVVPQFYTWTAKASNEGFEWVAFKTSGMPMRSQAAGFTSALRGMPLQVLTNAYQMSPREAQAIKTNRGSQTYLLSPARYTKQH